MEYIRKVSEELLTLFLGRSAKRRWIADSLPLHHGQCAEARAGILHRCLPAQYQLHNASGLPTQCSQQRLHPETCQNFQNLASSRPFHWTG